MSARILVVDDLAPNIHLLQVKLQAEYYDVLTASSGEEGLEIAKNERVDLVLLDAMMPGMDGFEVCAKLKSDPRTWQIPVVMVTALDDTRDRIRGLEAGADDFVTKPIDDFNLMARVRSLLRLKMVTDQLLTHGSDNDVESSRQLIERLSQRSGNILVVDDHIRKLEKVADPLQDRHSVQLCRDPKEALKLAEKNTDLIIVSLISEKFDGLRFCARVRSDARISEVPILAIGDPYNEANLVRAYDIGITDTVMYPVEVQELLARVNTQLRRKFYADSLRDDFNESLEMVVSDPLTGLGNRRFFDRNMLSMSEQATENKPYSMIIFDVDNFKRVNDILGHDVGDSVLKRIASRLASNLRAVDVISRYGGEEFVIAMPNTKANAAHMAADRIRALISGSPVSIDGEALNVTVSAGVAQFREGETPKDVFKRADEALYKAKQGGRDQVLIAKRKKAA